MKRNPVETGLVRMKGGFYSEFISRSFSREFVNTLDRLPGDADLGFVSVSIARFYELVRLYGTETGFQLLLQLDKGIERCFDLCFTGCSLISAEQIGINDTMICFRLPDRPESAPEAQAASFRQALCDTLNADFSDRIDRKVRVQVGFSRVSQKSGGGFYETLFRAFCDARRTTENDAVNSGQQSLKNHFNDIIEKSLLRCVYQPIMNLGTGKIYGWEAFVRGPEKGHFRQAATLFNFADEVGRTYFLDKRCREIAIRNLGELAPDQRLFMNVRITSLNDPAFRPGGTLRQARDCGLKPENIVIEFSECYGIRDYTLLLSNLGYYREQGFKIAIDNFGQSTLRFISQIRPDYIKIDAGLIRGISYHPTRKAIVEGVTVLSEKIGAKTVATGIETRSEMRTLSEAGVHFGQGYYIAQPAFPKPTDCVPPSAEIRSENRTGGSETLIRHLVWPVLQVTPNTLVEDVKNLLRDQPPLCSVVITRDRKPEGLLMSYHLDRQLGTQFGVSLFYHRQISMLMDPEPLIADADQPLGEVARAAMNRESAKIYDDIIVTEDEGIVGTVSVQRMLAALAKAEIRARESAETATRAKSRFLANMSHDIRTPMNAILGMADLLWESPLNTDQHKCVSVFRSAGENLLALVNDILDLSKVEAGQIELESIEFDLTELVEKLCEVIALRVHEKNVELLCHIAQDVPSRLRGDPTRLRQILSNLLGNAVRFTHKGEICLSVRRAERQRVSEAEEVVLLFSVADSGIGVPKDKLETVFDSFTQAHSSTNREFGGTGLGLAICRHLSALMGGRIWTESESGRGSTFRFTARFGTCEDGADERRFTDFRDLSFLVAYDNRSGSMILSEMLTRWGAKTTVTESGAACLRAVAQADHEGRPFEAILLDSRMPDGDGFEVAEQIRSRFGLQRRIVMMIPTSDISNDMVRSGAIGVACDVVKPVKRRELAYALCRVLGREVPPDPHPVCQVRRPEQIPPMRILLAEDNENNRVLFSFYMKGSPHRVEMAENGKICLEKYMAGKYDIVFMDIDMPVMDGYKATVAIREWEKEAGRKPVPIIALTAHALRGKRQESLDAGCTDHVSKPFKKDRLFQVLYQYSPASVSGADAPVCGEAAVPVTEAPESAPEEKGKKTGKTVCIAAELRELIPGFMDVTRQEIESLEAALADQNYDNIRRLGHRIKGASLCYGFEEMGKIACHIEEGGREKTAIETLSDLAGDLKDYMDNVTIVYSEQ